MSYSPVQSGKKVVVTAGSPVSLVAISTIANRVDIQALLSNTGTIAIGGIGISASTPTGIILQAGDVYNVEKIVDLFTILMDASVNGEGVSYTYWIGENV